MKIFHTFIFCFFFVYNAISQTTTITDSNFEQELINQGIDTNGLNGNILDTDAQAVTSLTLAGTTISDITGIEAFINLTDLDLGDNPVVNVDLSALNLLVSFTTDKNDALTTLDLSQNLLLETIWMESDLFTAGEAPIIVIDLSNNTNLVDIEIDGFRNVTDLILPVTPTLTDIYLRYLADISLDFSLLDGLEDLNIGGSAVSGVTITLPNVYTVLQTLRISSIDIPTIDISNYINLQSIYFWGTYVENLYLPSSTTLTDIFIILHDIQHPLDFSIMPNLEDIDITLNLATPLVVDVIQNFELTDLNLSNNDLASIDLTQNILLEELRLDNNNLTSLDVTQNINLYRLSARNNQLPTIDLTQNTILQYLTLSFNLLPNLDITQNVILNSIYIDNNLFTTTGLDLTQNPDLFAIVAHHNQIESLDITQNIVLSYLDVSYNLFSGTSIMDQFYTIRLNNNGIVGGAFIASFNQLHGQVPDFASLVDMQDGTPIGFDLAFDNNNLEFGHFEDQHNALVVHDNTPGPAPSWTWLDNIKDYFYAPQAKVDTIDTINANAGDSVTLTTVCAGTQNHYTWFKDGVAIPNAPDAPTYTIPSVNSCDVGVYYTEITSDLVPFENGNPPGTGGKNLLLIRNDITLNVTSPTESCVNLISPGNGSTNVPLNEVLTWTESLGACGYYLNVGTTSGGTDILNNIDVGDVESYTITSNLPPNTQIFITITPYFYNGTVLNCSEESFTTGSTLVAPNCTTLTYPLDGDIDVAATTDLYWNAVPNATSYFLTVGSSSGGNDILDNLDVGNVTTYDLPTDLPQGSTIYVSIIAYNAAGNATSCTEESFTTLTFGPNCTSLSNPLNGAVDVAISTDLSWNAVSLVDGYYLTVGTTSGGNDILDNIDVGNVTTYNLLTDLPQNTQIFVTVIPYNAYGNTTGCIEESFTTEILPPNCTSLSNPLNGTVDVAISTDLSWNAVSLADGYYLTVGTTSGGNDILDNIDVGNVTTYDLPTDLPQNTQIFVTIIPYNASGNATGCIEESFTTEILPPNCTSLSNPLNGAIDVAISTDLSWNAVSLADGYYLTVGTTSGGNDILDNIDVGNVTTYNLPTDLPGDSQIFVTISPYNTEGINTFCTEESFITELPLPGCSNLISPSFQENNVPLNATLSWSESDYASWYTITLGTNTGASDIMSTVNVGNITNFSPPTDLPNNTTVFVTITAHNATGSTVCGDDQFTTVDLSVNCVDLIYPTNGSTNVSLSTNLSWNVDSFADGYFLTVGTTSGGNDILNNINVGNTTSYSLINDLPQSTEIFVTVIPYNTYGNAIGCNEFNFVTELLIPDCTTIISPANGGTNVSLTTDISWQSVPFADGYLVSVGTVSGSTNIVNSQDVGNNTTFNFINNLDSNTTYYVTVVAYNTTGNAINCTEIYFTTEEVIPECTYIISPYNNELDVLENTTIFWQSIDNAEGYWLSLGTTPNGNDIVNNQQVLGTSYTPLNLLPEAKTIYVTITPYNFVGESFNCQQEKFTIIDRAIKPPAFFTPNGDSYNNTWKVVDTQNEIKQIFIFDRYGKLLKTLSNTYDGWDGTYKGTLLPTNDYWYVIELFSGETIKGHFTLKH